MALVGWSLDSPPLAFREEGDFGGSECLFGWDDARRVWRCHRAALRVLPEGGGPSEGLCRRYRSAGRLSGQSRCGPYCAAGSRSRRWRRWDEECSYCRAPPRGERGTTLSRGNVSAAGSWSRHVCCRRRQMWDGTNQRFVGCPYRLSPHLGCRGASHRRACYPGWDGLTS